MHDSKDNAITLVCAMGVLFMMALLTLFPQTEPQDYYSRGEVIATRVMPKPSPVVIVKTAKKVDTVVLSKNISKHYKGLGKKEAHQVVKLVYSNAKQQKLKPTLVLGLIAAESGFKSEALSHMGAVGYTQVIPRWHQDKIAGRDLSSPSTNIEVGVRILKDCFKKRGNQRGALACYNGATKPVDIDKYVSAVLKHVSLIESMLH